MIKRADRGHDDIYRVTSRTQQRETQRVKEHNSEIVRSVVLKRGREHQSGQRQPKIGKRRAGRSPAPGLTRNDRETDSQKLRREECLPFGKCRYHVCERLGNPNKQDSMSKRRLDAERHPSAKAVT